MRIKAGQHSIDGFGNQFLVFHRLDIITLDAAEYFRECTQLFNRKRMRYLLRFLIGDSRKIKAEHYPGDCAENNQTELLHFVAHQTFSTLIRNAFHFILTQFKGSNGLP